jgi:hypothetical protein
MRLFKAPLAIWDSASFLASCKAKRHLHVHPVIIIRGGFLSIPPSYLEAGMTPPLFRVGFVILF